MEALDARSSNISELRLYYNWAFELPPGPEKDQAVWTLLNSLIIELENGKDSDAS